MMHYSTMPPPTLYCCKCSVTHPNNWNLVFQSLPWPLVYKSNHLGMQTVSTNIYERMGRSQEFSEFQPGTVIGCHLCNKSSCDISSLLKIPQSTVSGIITKWKRLGTTATHPQSGRPHKMTELGQWILSFSERNSECFSIPRDVGQFHAPNFVGTVWGWPLPVPTWLCTSAQSMMSFVSSKYLHYVQWWRCTQTP